MFNVQMFNCVQFVRVLRPRPDNTILKRAEHVKIALATRAGEAGTCSWLVFEVRACETLGTGLAAMHVASDCHIRLTKNLK